MNGRIFVKNAIARKLVFWLSIQILSTIFLILRRREGDNIINILRCSCEIPIFIIRFFRIVDFSRHIFNKYSNIKFNDNSSSGNRFVPCGRIDEQTDMMKLNVTLRNFVKAQSNATDHTINRSPLAVAECKCVMGKFLIPKLHDSKIENLINLGPTIKIKFMSRFRKSFQMFNKTYINKYTVICWRQVKMALKARNITTTVCY